MPAPNSAMKAGHSAKSQKPADLHRNHLPACSGIGCRHAPEWGAALERIFQMDLDNKPDIPKIVYVGIPILLMWWAVVFVALAFISRDVVISKYGSIFIFIVSIPIYGILAIKNASKLGATINSEEQIIINSNIYTYGFKRHYVTKIDLWYTSILVIGLLLSFFIGRYFYKINEDQLFGYINNKEIIFLAILIGLFLKIKFGKYKK